MGRKDVEVEVVEVEVQGRRGLCVCKIRSIRKYTRTGRTTPAGSPCRQPGERKIEWDVHACEITYVYIHTYTHVSDHIV